MFATMHELRRNPRLLCLHFTRPLRDLPHSHSLQDTHKRPYSRTSVSNPRLGKYETKQHLAAQGVQEAGSETSVYTHRGARTHDHKVKSIALYRLS